MTEVSNSRSTRIGGLENEVLEKTGTPSQELSASVKAQIERNRQRALMLKQARLIPHPYSKINVSESVEKSIIRVEGSRFIDTGGGFLIEESSLQQQKVSPEELKTIPPPIIEPERPTCLECNEKFPDSFLLLHFDHPVCDKCRDNDDKHALITKTEAKNEYLLKDCDFDKRGPPLKFISRKNPHNSNWGEMKLYLQLQIEKRALEIWGTPEALEQEREQREEKKEKTKFKKYQKQMKVLRMNVRSSLYDRTSISHTHEFGPEIHVESDTYKHTCSVCGFEDTFEKM
ncbi:hypothetical protein RUM43_004359 [Polyplax serrata]|uniref:XPA C-terminal domain-containing protein n=1 Tax=Polyplax serrata TaxID=468196 RepID=A0AAN8SAV7_POLSC